MKVKGVAGMVNGALGVYDDKGPDVDDQILMIGWTAAAALNVQTPEEVELIITAPPAL
jgi:hypothetical protein